MSSMSEQTWYRHEAQGIMKTLERNWTFHSHGMEIHMLFRACRPGRSQLPSVLYQVGPTIISWSHVAANPLLFAAGTSFAQPGLILLVFAKTNGQVSKWSHVSWMPCTLYLQVEIRLVPWNTSEILRTACLQLVSLGFLDHSSAFFLATQCIMWKWSGRPVLCRELAAPNVLWIISVPRLAPRSNPPTPHTPSSLWWCGELSLLRGSHFSLSSN